MIRLRHSLLIFPVAGLLLLLAGCGGDDDEESSENQTDTAPAGQTATGPDRGGPPNTQFELDSNVRLVRDGRAREPRRRVEARAGDSVQIITTVRSRNTTRPARVQLVIPRGPDDRIEVTAQGAGADAESSATINAGRGEISLGDLRWGCVVPPAGFCPVEASATDDSYELGFEVPPGTAAVFTATVARG